MPLFTAQQLSDLTRETVPDATAAVAEIVVWGWLAPKLGLTEQPAELTPQVQGWAIELGAIYVENPTGLSSYQLGQEQWGYSAERRAEILAEAEASQSGSGGGGPRGCFPAARAYPDPAERCW